MARSKTLVKAKHAPLLAVITALAIATAVSACGGSAPPPASVSPRTHTFTMAATTLNVTILVREPGEWTIETIELSGSGVGIYSRMNTCDNVTLKVTSPLTAKTCVETVRVSPFETGKTATLTIRAKKVGASRPGLEAFVSMNTA